MTLPIIVLTGHGSIAHAVELTKRGVFAYLTKPYDPDALLAEVRTAVAVTAPPEDIDGDWQAEIVTRSPLMRQVLRRASLIAATDARVLIQGPSGTGKELLARAIHRASGRRAGPFVAVNCAAIPEHLIESEMFGHAKGAFTGAAREHKGLFQAADGGTLFLDEIGELPLPLQVKFLRVLQDGEFKRIGSTRAIKVDVRVIAATNKDLIQAISEKTFREDLFYRLNVIPIHLPPLRDRKEDIPLLINHFLTEFNKELGKNVEGFSPAAIQKMMTYQWPGNIRELKNKVKQAMVLTRNNVITAEDLFFHVPVSSNKFQSFKEAKREFEKEYISQVLRICQGNISQAARLARKDRKDFYDVMKKYGIQPEVFRKQQQQQQAG
jgi:two-component system response regulator GlrR